jgi:hypothetical protein
MVDDERMSPQTGDDNKGLPIKMGASSMTKTNPCKRGENLSTTTYH